MDQSLLAIFPIVGLCLIVCITGFYLLYKERRKSRTQNHNRKE